ASARPTTTGTATSVPFFDLVSALARSEHPLKVAAANSAAANPKATPRKRRGRLSVMWSTLICGPGSSPLHRLVDGKVFIAWWLFRYVLRFELLRQVRVERPARTGSEMPCAGIGTPPRTAPGR